MVKKRKLRAGELGKYFVIFILPALIIYLLFSITPFLYTIYYSFTDYTDMNPINLYFVGLKLLYDGGKYKELYKSIANAGNVGGY